MANAQAAARDILYSKQMWFDYRKNPGKSLAWLLEQQDGQACVIEMKCPDGSMTVLAKVKLELFCVFRILSSFVFCPRFLKGPGLYFLGYCTDNQVD